MSAPAGYPTAMTALSHYKPGFSAACKPIFCAVNPSGLRGEKEVYTGAGGDLADLSGHGLVDFAEEVASYHAGATG